MPKELIEIEGEDNCNWICSKDDIIQAVHDEYTEELGELDKESKDFLYTVKGIVKSALDNLTK
nr:hypothetical protein 6 [Balneolaceae bacterium]